MTRYRPLPFEIRAMPSGLTVTSLPGWLNITFAAVGEISYRTSKGGVLLDCRRWPSAWQTRQATVT